MRRRLPCFFIGLFFFATSVYGQAPNYAFQATTGVYTSLTGATPLTLTYNGSTNHDDGITTPANAVPIGFLFYYNGIAYPSIRPCANGWASFSASSLTNNADSWTNNLGTTAIANQRPFIAPLWDDMDMTSGSVSYLLSGSAPNRVLTIEWLNCEWDYNATTAAISFQVKLYETTNIIEFIYGQESGPVAPNSGGASIGLTSTNGSFLSLDGSGSTPLVSASVEKNDILSKPATGQIYRWIPYCTIVATNTPGEKISNFTYNTINNNSSSLSTYENFSNQLTTAYLFPNSVLPFSVTISSFTPTDQVILFLDFNHNGDFSDPGETLFTSDLPLSSGTITGNITIPPISATVLQGRTRIRIRLHDSANDPNATPCETTTIGQVEDYSVDIQPCFTATITSQPANAIICNNGNSSFTVGTSGTGLTYQWQVSTNGGSSYTNISNTAPYSGATSNTLTISDAPAAMNGYLYQVIVNGTCSPPDLTSSAASLTVNTPATITTNPANATVCALTTANFTVSAAGTSPSYHWQVSTDGGINYSNLAGANTAALSLPAVANSLSLNRYRALATVTACGVATSGAAILKVNPLPEVTLTAAPGSQIQPGTVTTLFATSNPAGANYSWTFNGTAVAGANGSTLVANINGLGKYKAIVTDVNGCTNTTPEVVLTELPGNRLFIYPNPSADGIFYVRLFMQSVPEVRTINVHNSSGATVASQKFVALTPYQQAAFDFRGIAAGIYTVVIRDKFSNIIAVGKVIIK